MEPALDERGDLAFVAVVIFLIAPQWSPLSTSGATRATCSPLWTSGKAAMEPALDERGDSGGQPQPVVGGVAAMEPALDERGDTVVQLAARAW